MKEALEYIEDRIDLGTALKDDQLTPEMLKPTDIPEWLHGAELDSKELEREIEQNMFDQEIEANQRFLESFVEKVGINYMNRESVQSRISQYKLRCSELS